MMDFSICNEFRWTKVSAVLGRQFGESFKTVACTVDYVGIFKRSTNTRTHVLYAKNSVSPCPYRLC